MKKVFIVLALIQLTTSSCQNQILTPQSYFSSIDALWEQPENTDVLYTKAISFIKNELKLEKNFLLEMSDGVILNGWKLQLRLPQEGLSDAIETITVFEEKGLYKPMINVNYKGDNHWRQYHQHYPKSFGYRINYFLGAFQKEIQGNNFYKIGNDMYMVCIFCSGKQDHLNIYPNPWEVGLTIIIIRLFLIYVRRTKY